MVEEVALQTVLVEEEAEAEAEEVVAVGLTAAAPMVLARLFGPRLRASTGRIASRWRPPRHLVPAAAAFWGCGKAP